MRSLPPLLLALLLGPAAAAHDTVEDGARVSIEYTVRLEDGTQAQSNVGQAPLEYTQGRAEMLPSLEAALTGLRVDERRTVTLTPQQGYGEVDQALVVEVDPEQIPAESRQPDAMIWGVDTAGRRKPVRVREVLPDRIVLDFNHPLAGHTLTFDVRVVGIR